MDAHKLTEDENPNIHANTVIDAEKLAEIMEKGHDVFNLSQYIFENTTHQLEENSQFPHLQELIAEMSNRYAALQSVHEINAVLENDLAELRRELRERKIKEKTILNELTLITRERDLLNERVTKYKELFLKQRKECCQLQITVQNMEPQARVRELESEVLALQKELETCKRNAKKEENELAQRNQALLRENKIHLDLEKKLKKTIVETETPVIYHETLNVKVVECGKELKTCPSSRRFQQRHRLMKAQLKKTNAEIESITDEKDEKYSELEQRTAKLVPRERLQEIPRLQRINREQKTEIEALKGRLFAFKTVAEERKCEIEKLVENMNNFKKLHLIEKAKNAELKEALKRKHESEQLLKSQLESKLKSAHTKVPGVTRNGSVPPKEISASGSVPKLNQSKLELICAWSQQKWQGST